MWVSWKIFIQENSQVAGKWVKWQVGQKIEEEEEEEESLNLWNSDSCPYHVQCIWILELAGREFNWN